MVYICAVDNSGRINKDIHSIALKESEPSAIRPGYRHAFRQGFNYLRYE